MSEAPQATALTAASPSSHSSQVTCVQRQFTRRRTAIAHVRRFVRQAISDHLPADRIEDVVLCASELATNALRHTPSGREFRVHLAFESDAVRLEVHDAGDGAPWVCEATEGDDHGRGLFLVAALADNWGISHRDGPGKAVWAVFQTSRSVPC
ncbi:ATP-binding protein [Streptomyces luteolus]|uniref:ATP-binding protein n=1 Tax=Streptomyces luteolus TaxID=3043615 RepID=A0ABT6T6Y4_9ACTN|nr:ATP-binding protein [Streptomyces sp. B-S-A12]MDI3422637.1 ATP-binding protein [Streptomyces sp. B-S-A12]